MENRYKVIGFLAAKDGKLVRVPEGTPGAVPLVDINMMPDFKWQLMCLDDRLKKPGKYAGTENVKAAIDQLLVWFTEYFIKLYENPYTALAAINNSKVPDKYLKAKKLIKKSLRSYIYLLKTF